MNSDIFKTVLFPILLAIIPTIILVTFGQIVLVRYRKSKEQDVELLRAVREQQYKAVELLYDLFSQFMALYREMSNVNVSEVDENKRNELMLRAIKAETQLDALIVRIVCEFVNEPNQDHEYLLGHLRQSAQKWRETLREGKLVHFGSSSHPDYVRFKETFASTAAFMVHHIHEHLEPPTMDKEQAAILLMKIFSKTYQNDHYQPIYNQLRNEVGRIG
jgi:hypothetical protein